MLDYELQHLARAPAEFLGFRTLSFWCWLGAFCSCRITKFSKSCNCPFPARSMNVRGGVTSTFRALSGSSQFSAIPQI